jgi:hypothetical protein
MIYIEDQQSFVPLWFALYFEEIKTIKCLFTRDLIIEFRNVREIYALTGVSYKASI